jgi:hypothetical protein
MAAGSVLFSDDFDGPPGSPPNPAHWGYDVGRWGASAGELQYYTDRTDNARLDGNGMLEIIAKPEEYSGAKYTSARLQTREKHSFRPPVRIESRIQMPAGTGLLSAFWTLGTDLFTRGWPGAGLEVVERFYRERGEVARVQVVPAEELRALDAELGARGWRARYCAPWPIGRARGALTACTSRSSATTPPPERCTRRWASRGRTATTSTRRPSVPAVSAGGPINCKADCSTPDSPRRGPRDVGGLPSRGDPGGSDSLSGSGQTWMSFWSRPTS